MLVREMGRGGTGVVYEARRVDGRGLAALKFPRSQAPLHRELLRREIAMLLRLSRHQHPGIVRVLEAELEGPAPFYAMELIEGPDLGAVIAQRFGTQGGDPGLTRGAHTLVLDPPPRGTAVARDRTGDRPPPPPGLARDQLEWALEVAAAVGRALAFIHAEGVLHADLSPRNVILKDGTTPVLIDFGTALAVRTAASAREVAQEEGLVAGTPAYMAPERLLGESLDARCDSLLPRLHPVRAAQRRAPARAGGPPRSGRR